MTFKISRKGDYGLLFLAALAKRKRRDFVSLRQVAKKNKLPYKFLGQVAGDLRAAGILESKEGIGGGYRLSRSAEYISVGEVLEALEGPVGQVTCARVDECMCGSVCVHEEVVGGATEAVMQVMNEQTIADLVGSKE